MTHSLECGTSKLSKMPSVAHQWSDLHDSIIPYEKGHRRTEKAIRLLFD